MQLLILLIVVAAGILLLKQARRQGPVPGGASPGRNSELSATISRLMNRRSHDVHPADAIDDARLAASGVVVAIATMDAPFSQAEIKALSEAAQGTFDVTEREALDIVSFGRWIAAECETQVEATERLSHRVEQLAGSDAGADLVRMIEHVVAADNGTVGTDEREAIDTVRKILRVT